MAAALGLLVASCHVERSGTGTHEIPERQGVAGSGTTGNRRSALRIGSPGQARWSPVITLPLVPAAAANLPDGKVLLWSSDNRLEFGGGGSTYTALLDPATLAVTESLTSETGHDMFCPGTTNLADGRVLVNGGVDSAKTSLFDPASGSWSTGAAMNISRGYNANTLLQDESVLTVGGSWSGGQGNKHAEVWTAATGWRRLSGVPVTSMLTADPGGLFRSDNHMWLIPTGRGRVLHAGPSAQMNWIETTGDGRIGPAGKRGDDVDSMSGVTVMYDAGKILKAGGSTAYEYVDANANAYVLDVSNGLVVRKLSPMAYPRAFHNAVVLPDGQVVIVGGQTYPVPFSDGTSVLAAELWNPVTETFRVLPAMTVPRNYHSVALLLPDATVLSAGGGLCGGCSTNHPDAQILTPPYLLNEDGTLAARPSITSAPSRAAYGSRVAVTTDVPVAAFALVRLGSTTHTVNNDQRRVSLAFQTTGASSYDLSIPSNPGVLIPGAYMLFALDDDGVPSVARTLWVSGADTVRLTPPGDRFAALGQATSLTLLAEGSGTSTVMFGAVGLPPGLSMETATGVISGSPTASGEYSVSVSASNAAGTVSTDFSWTVAPQGGFRFVKLEQLTEVNGGPWASIAEFNLLDPGGNALPRAAWHVIADGAETTGEGYPAAKAIDGVAGTMWHTPWSDSEPAPPHHLIVDMGGTPALGGMRCLPRQDGSANGTIARFRVYLSVDGVSWGQPIAEGDFSTMGASAAEKTVLFDLGQANRAPAITALAAQSSAQNATTSLQLAASDPDGDALTYAATGLPPGLGIDAAAGLISGGPTTPGTFFVTVTVTDSRGAASSVGFSWTIVAPTPVIAPVLAPPSQPGATVGYAASADGTALAYAWSFGDGTPSTPFDASATTSHVFATPGLYTVTLSVRTLDGQVFTRAFNQAIAASPLPGRPASSSGVALQAMATGGPRLWVVNPDNDTVTVFDTTTEVRLAEVPVGETPATVAVTPGVRSGSPTEDPPPSASSMVPPWRCLAPWRCHARPSHSVWWSRTRATLTWRWRRWGGCPS